MKLALVTIMLMTTFLVGKGQQPPPKPPKDPDSTGVTRSQSDTLHNKVFYRVEHEPEFPGGIEKLYRYIGKNLRYPSAAKENGIQGKVYITFVVEKDGSLTDFKIVRSLSPETDAEAIRLLKDGPKWNPGIQNGRPVRVSYSMPVDFELAN